ncbi:MAG: hypothetical protein QXI58_00895 [Candidatus Micrarchaeia archaeon]
MDVITGIVEKVNADELKCNILTDDGRRLVDVIILRPSGSNNGTGIFSVPRIGDTHIVFWDPRYNQAYLGPPVTNDVIKKELEEQKFEAGDILIYQNDGTYIKVYRNRVLILGTTLAETAYIDDQLTNRCVNYYLFTGGGIIKWIVDDENDKANFEATFSRAFGTDPEATVEIGDKANFLKIKIEKCEISIDKDSNIVIKNPNYEYNIDKMGNLAVKALKIKESSQTSIDIEAQANLTIKSNAIINVNANASVTIKAPLIILGNGGGAVVTNLTHPVCYITGLPIIGLPNIQAG